VRKVSLDYSEPDCQQVVAKHQNSGWWISVVINKLLKFKEADDYEAKNQNVSL